MQKKIRCLAFMGLVVDAMYLLTVLLYVTTQAKMALTVWEMLTIISAPAVLLILLAAQKMVNAKMVYISLMTAFMSCAGILTGVAHGINLAVTRPLMEQGVFVPEYLQIGYWPSVEMAVDYLGWGFFAGLAYLVVGFSIERTAGSTYRSFKNMVFLCGALCLAGFFGAFLINENLWYLAPMGYGPGTMVLCIQMLSKSHSEMEKE